MPGKSRAEYMRAYRARRAAAGPVAPTAPDTQDTSTAVSDGPSTPAGFAAASIERALPHFLAAPIDDCVACGHDRQQFHLNGPCSAPKGRRRCGCVTFFEGF